VAVCAGVDGVAVGVATNVGVAVREGVGVADGFLRTWRVVCVSACWLEVAGPTMALRLLIGSTFWVTQYVVPPPTARQPAIAAAAAPGRMPASGVGSTARE
jgi:hypothetical protein